MKFRPVGAELFRTYERKDVTKLTVAFRNFENAPQYCHIYVVFVVITFILIIS